MRKFLINIFFIIAILLVVNALGNLLFPVREGEAAFVRKEAEAMSTSAKHDILFIGSSRTYRHIDPLLFDELVEKQAAGTSYNFGIPATFAPEVYFCYEEMLGKLKPSESLNQTVIMELQEMKLLAPKNLNTVKGTYWITNDYLLFSIQTLWHSVRPLTSKLLGSGTFIIGWAINHFGFNYLNGVKPEKEGRKELEQNGFACLEDEMANKENAKDLWKRRNNFLRDTTALDARDARQRKTAAAIAAGTAPLNAVHLKKLESLIALSASKGIELLFLLPPRLPNYKNVLPLGHALGHARFIDLSSREELPELWMVKASFDVAHLNCQGAALYTNVLADKFEQLKPIEN